ncbi:MAG: hypothetical protein FWD04_06080 [Conexibacteraceae bacterium]|nr:hypothetical protein [Conexibacteraceae bacterium]
MKARPTGPIVTATVFILALGTLTPLTPRSSAHRRTHAAAGQTAGVYEWRPFSALTNPAYMHQLAQLRARGFDHLYLSLMDYPGLTSGAPANVVQAYSKRLTAFLQNVRSEGFAVSALGGDPSWVSAGGRRMNLALLRYVIDYDNSSAHPVKLDGIQFDDEPWALPGFMASYASAATQYLDTVADVLAYPGLEQAPNGFSVGFTAPFSFTPTDASIPRVTYDGTSDYAAYHALQLLNSRPGSYLSFLDYRNFTSGSNGSIAHARGLLAYAKAHAPDAGVVIGQETTNVQPAEITFFGLGFPALDGAMGAIRKAYTRNPAFRGFAVNDAAGLTALVDGG